MLVMQEKKGMPSLIALLVIILFILGYISYRAVNLVTELTTDLYNHPYAVSTAVLRINANIMNIQLTMKDVLQATTPQEVRAYQQIIDQDDALVLSDFQLVKDRFLGNPKMVRDALQGYLAWKSLREQVITLVLNGKASEAAAISSGADALQAGKSADKINAILNFAKNKAHSFQSDTQDIRTRALQLLLLSFGVAIFLVAIIFRRAINLEKNLREINEHLEEKVAKRTSKLAAANEEMIALNEEVTAMNEEIIAVNETLERRVEERTAELSGSFQELKATEEELWAQFDNLQETQEKLNDEKRLTEALFDSVPGMLYLYNDQGKLVRWNKQHEKMTGYSTDELSGRDLLAWYKGDDETIAHISNAVKKALREGFAEAEADLQRKDGTKLVAYMTAVPVKIDGKMHFAGFGIDIAARKKAEEEMIVTLEKAERANLAKSQFLANMSHEIRTPMNGIIGMTDLILTTDLHEEQRDYLTIVKSSTISLLRVLNDILDYSKIEAGKIELEKSVFDLKKTMNEVVDLFDIGARQKGLSLTLKIDERVPDQIVGDSVRLRQVLSNLVGNGIKFTYQGEVRIDVAVEEQSDQQVKIRFKVTDTGIGIGEEKLDKLFKRFSQVDESNTREFGGTGLGLAISKKLIEIMDGAVDVESKENVGSSFFFTAVFGLPEEEVADAKKEIDCTQPKQRKNAKSKKVLLAEDDEVSKKIVTIMLERKGYKVVAVQNGMEAIAAFEDGKFDLILMDINMPYMDGYSATVIIRAKEELLNCRTPIIAMTAYALNGDREKCLDAGMDDYISKPISLEQTMNLIERYVRIAN